MQPGIVHADALVSEVDRDLQNHQSDQETVRSALRFMKACCDESGHGPKSTLPQLIDRSVILSNRSLYEAAIKRVFRCGHETIMSVLQTIIHHIQQDYDQLDDPEDFGAESWEKWYGVLLQQSMAFYTLH